MQNLSLLQLLKILSSAAPASAAPAQNSPSAPANEAANRPQETPMPETNGFSPSVEKPSPGNVSATEAPDLSARAYENFLFRHEQAVRRVQKNK